jgi:hypothetical protein
MTKFLRWLFARPFVTVESMFEASTIDLVARALRPEAFTNEASSTAQDEAKTLAKQALALSIGKDAIIIGKQISAFVAGAQWHESARIPIWSSGPREAEQEAIQRYGLKSND